MDFGILPLILVAVISFCLGRYIESFRTGKMQHVKEHEKRAADKGYVEEVKAIEKSLKKLKGKLGI